jgi:mannose-6-phosphate isomerase-like protein (cupin superfamily)
VLLSGDEAAGRSVVFSGTLEHEYGAPPHHQPSEEEIFYVLEGEMELICGSAAHSIGRGAFGFAPRNATHGFLNKAEGSTRIFTINSPAGHERGFEMLVREGESERLPELLVAHGWRMHEENSAA